MGNQGSIPVSYGRKLLCNAKVEWLKVDDDQFDSRDGHCSATVGSKLFVFGGVRWDEEIGEVSESNKTLVFDSSTQKWSMATVTGSTPSPRSAATMAGVGKNVYVFGGLSRESGWLNDMYVFDTDTLQWNQVQGIGNCPSPRDKLCSVTVGRKIYVFGGFGPKIESEVCSGEAEFQWYNDLYTFDTETCIWKKLNPNLDGIPTPRAAHCMCVIDNELIIFGGRDSIARRHDLYVLNLDKNEWLQPEVSGNTPLPRGLHTLNIVNDYLILYGGSSAFDKETMQPQEYHSDTFLIKTG
ncbi:hypothetical protein QZH41_015961 [Actinostola sp. cb2023]|nr:hypothetical protein QZH41_015961 [Actinostola sp. cb2023]